MNYLIAKVKKENEYLKVISDVKLYSITDVKANAISYDPAYKLEEDEWFKIEDFSQKGYCIELLKIDFNSIDYKQLTTFDNIEYLCSYQDEVYFFQKTTPSQIIRKKYLMITNRATINDKPLITINNEPDAFYDKANNTLFFKKLNTITSIFRGIDMLYKEATQEETEIFLQNSFIQLNENFNASSVKTANRKRIAMAMDTLSSFSDSDRKSIYKYIKSYCNDLNCDDKDGKFLITSENDLKHLLYGIEQRYYTTVLGGEKRLANSIMKLD